MNHNVANGSPLTSTYFSNIAPLNSTVLRSSWGDLVLSATTSTPPVEYGSTPPPTSIRFGTNGQSQVGADIDHPADVERMTIWYNGQVGIGTGGYHPSSDNDMLRIHISEGEPFLSSLNATRTLGLSYGLHLPQAQWKFFQIGFEGGNNSPSSPFSLLSNSDDFFLRLSPDVIPASMILTNERRGGSIRFATTPTTATSTPGDVERMLIAPNGNVGINLPKDSIPKDQMQFGGGVMPYPGNPFASPGLTIYGGNRYENMPILGGGGRVFPGDWRYISYNHWVDHTNPDANRSHRFEPMSSSGVAFSENWGGNIDLTCFPYDATRGIDDFTHEVTLELHGESGLEMWSNQGTGDPYHFLFEIQRPGFIAWPFTRNPYGLAWHHTPVYIGLNAENFSNLPVRPNIGDDTTWMLAVDGPALFKEAFVSTDWPDFVFDQSYSLMPLQKVEAFIKANNHLPGVPSAKEIATTGVPLGATSAKQMQKTEELTLYVIDLNKQIEALKQEVEALKKGGTR